MPAERCGFLSTGIGDTASRKRVFDLYRFAYGKKQLLIALIDVPSTHPAF
jgi:hypothetical protein